MEARQAQKPAKNGQSGKAERCSIKNAAQYCACWRLADEARPFPPEEPSSRKVELWCKAKEEPREQRQGKGEAGGFDQGSGWSGKRVSPF